MKLSHKPTKAEGKRYEPGMEDGILAYCSGKHAKRFFDSVNAMRESPDFSKVKESTTCILVENHPVPVADGDWVINGQVVTEKEFAKNWEEVKGPGRPKSEKRRED